MPAATIRREGRPPAAPNQGVRCGAQKVGVIDDRRSDVQLLYRWLSVPEEPDQSGDTRPSLLPWLGFGLIGLLTVIILTAGMLGPPPIGWSL